MYLATFFPFFAFVGQILASPVHVAYNDVSDLEVDNPPDYVRPYVIRHYATASAVTIGAQTYRFYVTGNSSGGAFTILSTNAPSSASLGVLPHIHQRHYENFFNYKGRYQLWAQKGDGEQQSRILGPGDYGSVVRNTTHTFKMLDPDTELLGTIVPGGFEALFFAQGTPLLNNSVHSAYVPQVDNATSVAGPDAATISVLEDLDVYAQLDFKPRMDAIDGSIPANSGWHAEPDYLGAAATPYFIANGWGPKYLNSWYGYQIIAPLAGPEQTQDTDFTQSTISISALSKDVTARTWNLTGATGIEVLEGELIVRISTYDPVVVTSGDVVFIPPYTLFSYWSQSYLTKVLNINGGHNGLDRTLIEGGEPYNFTTFPIS